MAASIVHAEPVRAPYAEALERYAYERLQGVDGEVALWVHDLDRELQAGVHERRRVYLASGVKLLFLVEAYRQRENGQLSFDEELRYTRADVRDGAPAMNRRSYGSYPVSELVLLMMRDSDNAASDLVARRLGLAEVQRGLEEQGIADVGPLVDLMDVRREVYRWLDPRADRLSAVQVRDLRWRDGFHPRLDLLQKHIGPPYGSYGEVDLEVAYDAYDAYYALGRNHAPLKSMGAVLARLARRELVSPAASDEMLRLLLDTWSAGTRLRAAVPPGVKVAHKTGTQRRRVTDLGLTWLSDGSPLVLCLAVSELPHEEAEAVLRDVAAEAYRLADEHARSEGELVATPFPDGAPVP